MENKKVYHTIGLELNLGALLHTQTIQTLWSGYGSLVRLQFEAKNIIVKHVLLPKKEAHPKGWNSNRSHQRKLHSYEVEVNWYEHFSQANDIRCSVPKGLKTFKSDTQWLIVMEDLAQSGFDTIIQEANKVHIQSCLKWLANFHGKFMGQRSQYLWDIGTYWHLGTRPDELEALKDDELKKHAKQLDNILNNTSYQTIVHGDAKLANFCFNAQGSACAAVDFQYVGHGCGMKDVIYFMSSAIAPEKCKSMENWVLDTYFEALHVACIYYNNGYDAKKIEQEWRPLFVIAWADFYRFLKGWSPTHYKINSYTETVTKEALQYLHKEHHV